MSAEQPQLDRGRCRVAGVVHKGAGIVEPITMSILQFLRREWQTADNWIAEVIARKSVPLLVRVDIALSELTKHSDLLRAEWANQLLAELIHPAIKRLLDPSNG